MTRRAEHMLTGAVIYGGFGLVVWVIGHFLSLWIVPVALACIGACVGAIEQ